MELTDRAVEIWIVPLPGGEAASRRPSDSDSTKGRLEADAPRGRSDGTNLEGYRALLDESELARAERFRFERHRVRFIAVRAVLRSILGHYLGVPPTEVAFQYGEHGKPFVEAAISFNISDSSDLAVMAFTRNREVGIDLERLKEKPNAVQFARRFFATPEHEAIAAAGAERDRWFFACWTRKESYVKARGEGLSLSLSGFSVECDPDIERPRIDAPGRWSLRSFEPQPGYAGALCVEGGEAPEMIFRQFA